MREILLVCAVVVGAVVAGTAATHAVRGFWCDVRGDILAVSPFDVDRADQLDVEDWDFAAGRPSKERQSSLSEYKGH